MSLCTTCTGDGTVPAPAVGMRYTMPDQPCPDCGGSGEKPEKAPAEKPKSAA